MVGEISLAANEIPAVVGRFDFTWMRSSCNCCASGFYLSKAKISLNLSPVAYIASEAATATAMHIFKIFIYSKLTEINMQALLTGLAMGLCMFIGTYTAKHFIKKLEKNKFQKLVAFLMCAVGIYMIFSGA